MGKRNNTELPWVDIEVSSHRGTTERVSLSVMEVRSVYTSGDGHDYAGERRYVVTAWIAEDSERKRAVGLRCIKVRSDVVHQVGDAFLSVRRAAQEMAAVRTAQDWGAWRWLALEEVEA